VITIKQAGWRGAMLVAAVTSTAVMTVLLTGCGSAQKREPQAELATSSDQTGVQKRAEIRLQLAIGYYEQRQFPVALDEVKQALAADPDYADAYGMRALIYMEMGENQLAEDNFNRALKIAPDNPDVMSNYGWFLCQHGHEAQAIPLFDRALANHRYASPVKALNNAGVCSDKLHNAAVAERYFLQAFRLEPANVATNFNLAKLYYQRPDLERAQFYIARVTKPGSNEILAANILWLAAKIGHKTGDVAAVTSLGTQLRRHHAASPEYAAYQRGAFDE
jgi:type IV pilus assembly protein PilF